MRPDHDPLTTTTSRHTVGAVGGHLRVGDTKNLAMPPPPLALAIAALVLRLATA